VHRTLMLAHLAERQASAATDEVSQIVTAEMNALFDRGVFSLPAGPSRTGQKTRRPARIVEQT
jgi:hypothetical protein